MARSSNGRAARASAKASRTRLGTVRAWRTTATTVGRPVARAWAARGGAPMAAGSDAAHSPRPGSAPPGRASARRRAGSSPAQILRASRRAGDRSPRPRRRGARRCRPHRAGDGARPPPSPRRRDGGTEGRSRRSGASSPRACRRSGHSRLATSMPAASAAARSRSPVASIVAISEAAMTRPCSRSRAREDSGTEPSHGAEAAVPPARLPVALGDAVGRLAEAGRGRARRRRPGQTRGEGCPGEAAVAAGRREGRDLARLRPATKRRGGDAERARWLRGWRSSRTSGRWRRQRPRGPGGAYRDLAGRSHRSNLLNSLKSPSRIPAGRVRRRSGVAALGAADRAAA